MHSLTTNFLPDDEVFLLADLDTKVLTSPELCCRYKVVEIRFTRTGDGVLSQKIILPIGTFRPQSLILDTPEAIEDYFGEARLRLKSAEKRLIDKLLFS